MPVGRGVADTKPGRRASKETPTCQPPTTPGMVFRDCKEAGSLRSEHWPSFPTSTAKGRAIMEQLNLAI